MTARERHRAAVFARDETRPGHNVCALAALGACGGFLQADHVLRVQVLERRRGELVLFAKPSPGEVRFLLAALDDLIADARNGWVLCERHHRLKDGKLIPVSRWLPGHFWTFVDEYGLDFSAEREGFVRSGLQAAPHGLGAGAATRPPRRR